MQTISFTRHLEQITRGLKAQEMVEFLRPFLDNSKNPNIPDEARSKFANLVFASKEGYFSLAQVEDRKRILESMGFAQIFESTQLAKMLTAFNTAANASQVYGSAATFPLFSNLFQALSIILRFQQTTSTLLYEEKIGTLPEGYTIIEVEIVDYDGTGIDIARVQSILASLSALHEHLARLLGDRDARISISFVDSGSDFVFALQSTKAIVDIAKVLFEQYWNKIRFKTYDDFDRKLESLAKGLKFAELVEEQVAKQVIDEETGRILKFSILDEMTNLTGAGATLKDVSLEERVDRRKLLVEKRGVKLLGSGKGNG